MRLFLMSLLVLVAGCASGPEPFELCEDMVGALATSATRCGFDGAATREAFLQDIGGSCAKVVEVRDAESLEADCVPWIRSVPCDVLASPNLPDALPPSCKKQLIHK